MEVIIDEILSIVRAVDRDSILSPATLQKIIDACVRAAREDRAHEERASAERKSSGVSDAMWER